MHTRAAEGSERVDGSIGAPQYSPMGRPLHVIDAFADGPFTGNPAAVCLIREPVSEEFMQALAAEMNLSETAFLVPQASGFGLRWFTPTVEVELCGHATLASAHFLYTMGLADPAKGIDFHTKSGLLRALPAGGGIEIVLPARAAESIAIPEDASEAVGVTPIAAYRADRNLILELSSEAAVRAARPNMAAIAALDYPGVALTAPGDSHDFVSRYFAPALGVPEDPVTGSLHCALGPLWASRLGREELKAFQASQRGGEVMVIVEGESVSLLGFCVTVLRGGLHSEVG